MKTNFGGPSSARPKYQGVAIAILGVAELRPPIKL